MSRLWTALEPLLAEDAGPLSIDEMAAYLGRHVPGAGWTRRATRDRVKRCAFNRGIDPARLLLNGHRWLEVTGWPIVEEARDEWEPVSAAVLADRLTVATKLSWTEQDVRRLVPMAERAHGCRGSCLVAV